MTRRIYRGCRRFGLTNNGVPRAEKSRGSRHERFIPRSNGTADGWFVIERMIPNGLAAASTVGAITRSMRKARRRLGFNVARKPLAWQNEGAISQTTFGHSSYQDASMDRWHSVVDYWRLFLQIWTMFACIATALSVPIVLFSLKRVSWNIVDLFALILPFTIWLALFISYSEGRKSLSNLGEPGIIALAVPGAVLIRVAVGKRFSRTVCSSGVIALLSLFAACVFWCTPALRE